ncbi:hypothetical protein [Anaerotignum sp. MB30-C6]|uniref:hypothetical protein n=1 Tax=Anaerotignum sp. MB30-C6 TaxID=3070814 RepID=UPI0027DD6380|nr:hypothetical protein [Anaerotignum sp. MB30-C6]WMI80948.1 hypothetical protein RBQ60_14175 [Anaerotignum sp. MB30-C6]
MNKGCRELDVFVGTKMKIAHTGKEVLYAIIGMMSKTDDEPEFNTCKELLDKALLNLIAFEDEIIPQEDFAMFLELLEECEFEEEEPGIDLIEVNTEEASRILSGMHLSNVHTLCNNSTVIGRVCAFRSTQEDEGCKFRNLLIQFDGRILVSEEY